MLGREVVERWGEVLWRDREGEKGSEEGKSEERKERGEEIGNKM